MQIKEQKAIDLKEKIRNIPDFPQKGIIFRDITTLLKDREAYNYVIDALTEKYKGKGIDYIAAIDARGYIFGAPLAYNIGAGLVPVRKKGKLPYETFSEEYELEYGKNILEIHKDAIEKGKKVLIVDDLIATGGSALASAKLVDKLGGEVSGFAFIIELTFLDGREKLKGYDVFTMVQY